MEGLKKEIENSGLFPVSADQRQRLILLAPGPKQHDGKMKAHRLQKPWDSLEEEEEEVEKNRNNLCVCVAFQNTYTSSHIVVPVHTDPEPVQPHMNVYISTVSVSDVS